MPNQSQSTTPISGDHHIAVDGSLMHVRIGGGPADLPTVVLEAGGGSTLETWDLITQRLAPHLRVLSYERAGVGTSEGHGASCAEAAGRLSTLLDAAQIKKPVILAGHSLGGLYARYFAATRSRDIAGLVLIDSTPDDQPVPRALLWLLPPLSWGVYLAARSGLLRLFAGSNAEDVPQAMRTAQRKAKSRASHVRAVLAEIRGLRQTQQDAAAQVLPKTLPVLCISAGKRPRAKLAAAFMRNSHDRLAAAGLQPWSRHHCIAGATHASLLTHVKDAETVGKLILEFAGRISPGVPATVE
ncbi:MAG: alpha/beta fold hydrolase [Nevskia sp.]|nr:alpha/beta fold hydrolase [Nevskia sp.]